VNDVANWLMLYIVNSVWQIPLLAACTAALLRIVARADGKVQFHLWVGCLVICIALPALSAMSPLPQLTVYRGPSSNWTENRGKPPRSLFLSVPIPCLPTFNDFQPVLP
jgi:hypothetical protein